MKNGLCVLVLLLSACHAAREPASPDGAGHASDAAPTAAPVLLSSSPKDAASGVELATDITLSFSTDMDPESTRKAVTIAPSPGCTPSVSGATYTCAHATLAPATTYTVTVAASAASTSWIPLAAPAAFTFTTAGAVVTSLVVSGATNTQVRQGAGKVSIEVGGHGLASVTNAILGSLVGTVLSASDTMVVLTVSVPHGLTPGGLSLTLLGAVAPVVLNGAVNVTPIHADADAGNDDSAGTTSAPFATLSVALSVAADGDTVTLADGTYSVGETWPGSVPPSFVNVPSGVNLIGTSTAGTIVMPAPGSPDGRDGLVLTGTSHVSDLSVHGFERGVVAVGGHVGIERVHVYGNALDGVYAMNDAILAVLSSELDTNGTSGIFAGGGANVYASMTRIHDNTTGVFAAGSSHFDVDSSNLYANGRIIDKTHSGVFLTDSATATIGATVDQNATAGVYSESTGELSLPDNETNGNGTATNCFSDHRCSGVVVAGTGDTRMNGGESSSNASSGLMVMGPPKSVAIDSVKLHANGTTNAWFSGAGPSMSTIAVTNSQLSDTGDGIVYGDWVGLTVTTSSITDDALADLLSAPTHAGSENAFVDCSFGSDSAPTRFPATTGTVVESSDNGSAPGGPSWSIVSGTLPGAPFVFQHS